MRSAKWCLLAGVLCWTLAGICSNGWGESKDKNKLTVSGGKLRQDMKELLLRVVETPALGKPDCTAAATARTLAHVAEVGGTGVFFTLSGFSADGKTLAPEEVKAIGALMDRITYQRMGAVCRVFSPNAPKEPAYRKAAIEAAAQALKAENRVVYWIDGPETPTLIKAFKAIAPDLIVAAFHDGDIDVVTDVPKNPAAKPVLLVAQIPPPASLDTVHFLLPEGEENYTALDAALADPAESKPWTPDTSALTEQERTDGFISLFDGKSLDGWWIIGKKKDGFVAKDGARRDDGMIEWNGVGGAALYTRDRYDNFILRLEWKIKEKGNSGIYLRAPRAGRQSKVGMEFQLQGDAGTPITDQTTGAIYSVVPPKVNACKPAGEWNTLEITLNGPALKAVLNEQTVQDLNLDESDELKVRLRKGFIGLQDHGNYVAFRNIRIKKL